MAFYGREKERKSLKRFFAQETRMAALIYGRRRVGKSELIKQSLRESDIPSIYYECKQTTEMNNVESLAVLISEKYGYPKPAFSGMEEALDFLFGQARQEKLIRMELVRKEAPINDEKNRKKSGYYIMDNLSLFYYRYVFRYSSQLNVMDPEVFFDRYIKTDFEEKYVPKLFEEICRQYLIRQNRRGGLEEPFEKIGKYYYDNPQEKTKREFDIVTWGPQGYVFYEAKFKKAALDQKTMEMEIAQVEKSPLSCCRYGFFSRSGFAADMKDVMLFTLEDLFEDV